MIRPANFGFNTETAENNEFQAREIQHTKQEIQENAVREFDTLVFLLREKNISVDVFEDSASPAKPDAVFPNNWISTHSNGTVVLYPMFAPNRRMERRKEIVDELKKRFQVRKVLDLSNSESNETFLEGTGSLVLDRENKIVYACISPRTDKGLVRDFCEWMGYKPVIFHAVGNSGIPIYHTNVVMCVGEKFAVVCMDSIQNYGERNLIVDSLRESGKEIIEISLGQMLSQFAGNMLELTNSIEKHFIVMSGAAFNNLEPGQKEKLTKYGEIISVEIPLIEKYGGGSVRCMIAENFLPLK